MDKASAFEQLKDRLTIMARSPEEISPADIDELILLTEAFSALAPTKFSEVLEGANRAFPDHAYQRKQLVDRLRRIVEVAETLPKNIHNSNTNDALIPTFALSKRTNPVCFCCANK